MSPFQAQSTQESQPESRNGSDPVPDSLVRLFERPAPALAVALPAPQGLAAWRGTLSGGRLLVALALTPLLFWAYAGQVGRPVTSDPSWMAGLALLSLVGALTLSTYFPRRAGATAVGGSPCASLAGLYVLFAGMALGGSPATASHWVLAVALVSFGLLQRLRGASACG